MLFSKPLFFMTRTKLLLLVYRDRGEIAGECICPLSWSVHHNFVRDGKYSLG
jgi:hypothetical protein